MPDESDLAPLLLDAYLSGGEQREILFRSGDAPGASFVSGGSLFILPNILAGVFLAAPYILNILTSTAAVKDALTIVCNTLTLHDRARRVCFALQPHQTVVGEQDPNHSIRQIVAILEEQLKATSLPEDERDLVAYRVIRSLLDQPDGTIEAIGRIRNGQ